MEKQIIVLALVFFAVVGMATASAPAAAPSGNDGPISFNNDGGSTTTAVDAAPVGSPVPAGAFPDLTPTNAPPASNTASSIGGTVVFGTVAAGIAGSLFF